MNNKIMYDSFELLYVYIKKIDRCFEDTYFSFTNDYDIEYDYDNKRLKIVKKDASVLTNFFSNKIKSINLIVGKNGCGKTTLFDLLGLKRVDRYELFTFDNKDRKTGWFALYKCGSTNEFYVEGFNPELLFKPQELINDQMINQLYAIHFYYDFETMMMHEKFFSNSDTHINLSFLYYHKEIIKSQLLPNKKIVTSAGDPSYLINRKYIKTGNLANLYYLASNNYSFFKEVESNNLKIMIKFIKNNNYQFVELSEILKNKFSNLEYLNLKVQERYRYILLKNIIFEGYKILENSEKRNEYLLEIKNIDKDLTTITKINLMCSIACGYIKKYGYNFLSYSYLDTLCQKISELPDSYLKYKCLKYQNDSHYVDDYLGIEINLNEQFNQNIYDVLELYELLCNHLNFDNLKKFVQIHLNNNISEGELQLINTYSGIYYALTNEYKNQKSAIILLDEPDKSFHPMWISSFIDNLVKLVESIDNEMQYQFIISTHSPFMLSDIPKDYITCIDIVDHQRIVSKAKKSFASNYYDIIKDTFFLEDSVGMFAKRKINEMIEVINNIDNNINEKNFKRINDMISVIDDDYLKNILHSELNKKISNFNQKIALELERENLIKRINEISMKLGELNY
ncbi:AAA family ATPase [Thomasclavelia spiroformis DSM 1552]|nr:AAA family ATPase [Thomasclavelia spiroformis]UWO90427.1 AAA family ATPase [Thomasclavelia spiroformis DSM 1552]